MTYDGIEVFCHCEDCQAPAHAGASSQSWEIVETPAACGWRQVEMLVRDAGGAVQSVTTWFEQRV